MVFGVQLVPSTGLASGVYAGVRWCLMPKELKSSGNWCSVYCVPVSAITNFGVAKRTMISS
jgi:hypothetical protein